MPCRCDGWSENPTPDEKIAELETLLCAACKVLCRHDKFWAIEIECKEKLLLWWQQHQEEDRRLAAIKSEEERKKQLKVNALAKLTKDEIAALKGDIIPF